MSGWRRELRRSSDGYEYWIDVPPMPRLQDLFLNSSVYIYYGEEQAKTGRGGEGGTGFITTVPAGEPWEQALHSYIVTAKHVISDRAETYLRINRRFGKPAIFRVRRNDWLEHEDADIAILALGLNAAELKIAMVPQELYVAQDMMAWPDHPEYDYSPERLGIGDECYFFGRFMGYPGVEKNLPMLRFGNLAMMPTEPLYGEEAFLVEFKSMPGFSGSPVFIYRTGTIDFWNMYTPVAPAPRSDALPLNEPNRIHFLGVDFCHLPELAELGKEEDGKFRPLKHLWIKHSAGIMGVIPAWKVKEVLMRPDVARRRKEIEDEHTQQRDRQAFKDSIEPALEAVGDESEFERFEEFTRKLVNVPKEEIDEKRKERDS